MCAFQTDLSILKDYDTDFFQARSSEKRTLIERTEVWLYFKMKYRYSKFGRVWSNKKVFDTAIIESVECILLKYENFGYHDGTQRSQLYIKWL